MKKNVTSMDMPCLNTYQIYMLTALSVAVSNIDVTTMKKTNSKNKEIQLSLNTKELTDEQNNNTFYSIMVEVNK